MDDVNLFGEIQVLTRAATGTRPTATSTPANTEEKVRKLIDEHVTVLAVSP